MINRVCVETRKMVLLPGLDFESVNHGHVKKIRFLGKSYFTPFFSA